jgi:hypothetical protein
VFSFVDRIIDDNAAMGYPPAFRFAGGSTEDCISARMMP